MKKALIALIAAGALALVGCSNDDVSSSPPPANTPSESTTTPEPEGAECATDCVAEYSAAIEALEACDTFGDAQGCDDAIHDLQVLHDPILATHGAQASAQVAMVESMIAEWDENGCATKNSCTLEWLKTATEAKQLRLDMKQY